MSVMQEALTSFQQRNNAQLENWLQALPHQNLPLIEAMRYGLLLGGKRARPFFGLYYGPNARL